MARQCRLGLLALAVFALALSALARSASADADANARVPIPIWNGNPPGVSAAAPAEQVRLTEQGEHIVSSVHRPSLTPYLPEPLLATGAAVIIVPGGGHRELWMDHEGYRVAQWLASHGIAAFVLKYRLALEPGSHYTVAGDELADLQRAIRLVRHRAADWHVDAKRVGVLGFSAGGELALLAATRPPVAVEDAADDVARESASPDFAGLMYPGNGDLPLLNAAPPPMFLLCGEQDPAIAARLPALQTAIEKAGGSAELHILAHANHGFGMRDSNPPAIAIWPTLFRDWLDAGGFLARPSTTAPTLSEQMRAAFPGAAPVAALSAPEIAQVLRKLLSNTATPTVGEPQVVSPNEPYSPGGAHLSFWKPAFLLGTAGGGEAGFNFWNLYNEGHVNVGFTRHADAPLLLDCRMYSSGNVAFKIYAGDAGALTAHGELAATDGHALLLLASAHAGPASVELWPNPAQALLGFFGCALWPYSVAR
ncbi:MAG: alpha/beta hydrolase [Steroidobacteraceae bacterium]